MWRTFSGVGTALLALLALSGCGLFSAAKSTVLGAAKPADQACPAAIILHPLANTAVFAPGTAPRPENVAFYGILDEVDSHCTAVPGAVRMHLTVDVIAQRGPAAKGNNAVDFNYFIAVIGPGERILQKQPFTVRVTIPADKLRAGVADRFDEVIPLDGYKAKDLNLDLGFQQSPETVNFYHHFRGRSAGG
jgi:hypothetical protein